MKWRSAIYATLPMIVPIYSATDNILTTTALLIAFFPLTTFIANSLLRVAFNQWGRQAGQMAVAHAFEESEHDIDVLGEDFFDDLADDELVKRTARTHT